MHFFRKLNYQNELDVYIWHQEQFAMICLTKNWLYGLFYLKAIYPNLLDVWCKKNWVLWQNVQKKQIERGSHIRQLFKMLEKSSQLYLFVWMIFIISWLSSFHVALWLFLQLYNPAAMPQYTQCIVRIITKKNHVI